MKKTFLLLFCVVAFLSCSKEDDIIDLSTVDDYMMELTIIFDSSNPELPYEFDVIEYQTSGSDELISYPTGYNTDSNFIEQNFNFAVKEYKTVGLKIMPVSNVVGYRFRVKEINALYPNTSPIVNIQGNFDDGDVTIFYNFDTEELIVE